MAGECSGYVHMQCALDRYIRILAQRRHRSICGQPVHHVPEGNQRGGVTWIIGTLLMHAHVNTSAAPFVEECMCASRDSGQVANTHAQKTSE